MPSKPPPPTASHGPVIARRPVVAESAEKPLRRDAEENRRRVLEAAAEVFAAHGLDASVEEIAQSAGVGMGTLYRRFPNKEALIDQLSRDLFDEVLAAGHEALETTDGTGLETFVRRTAALQQAQRGCMSRLWLSPVPAPFLAEMDQIIAELLARAQAAGLVRQDCVPTDLSLAFWAIRGVIESAGEVAPEAYQRFVDLIVAGLRPSPAPLPHPPVAVEQRQATRLREPRRTAPEAAKPAAAAAKPTPEERNPRREGPKE